MHFFSETIYSRGLKLRKLFFFWVRSVATLKPRWKFIFNIQSHLPATPLHSLRSDVDIFRSVVPTLQYPDYRSQPPVLSVNSLHWSAAHCAKILSSYDSFIRGKTWNHREPSAGGCWWVIKHFPSKTLQEPLCRCCSRPMRPSIVMKKDDTWGQHSSSFVLIKGI